MTAIDCVVVNFNAGELLSACVRDLLEQRPGVRITVLDNASADGSLEGVAALAETDSRLRLLRNDANAGFAAGCNRAASESTGAFLAFVNPDCRLPPEALDVMRRALESDPGAALAGALVRDPDGSPQRGTFRRLPTPWRALMTFTGLERLRHLAPALAGVNGDGPVPDGPIRVEAVNGACLVVRRSVFESLGGFDTGYFLHCEDLDLFMRLRRAGHGVLLVPVPVTHYRGTSSDSAPLLVHWHKHRGMLRYLWRHHARGRDLAWLPFAALGIGLRLLALAPAAVFRHAAGKR